MLRACVRGLFANTSFRPTTHAIVAAGCVAGPALNPGSWNIDVTRRSKSSSTERHPLRYGHKNISITKPDTVRTSRTGSESMSAYRSVACCLTAQHSCSVLKICCLVFNVRFIIAYKYKLTEISNGHCGVSFT